MVPTHYRNSRHVIVISIIIIEQFVILYGKAFLYVRLEALCLQLLRTSVYVLCMC